MDYVLNNYHRNIPSEELLKDLLRVYQIVGAESLSQQEYRQYGKYGTQTFCRRFGGWNEALKICGIQPNIHQEAASKCVREYASISNKDLLDDIRIVAAKLRKKTITSTEYALNGRFSKDICFRRFGSWNNVLKEAGLEPFTKVTGKRIDEVDLLQEINRLWISLGRQPTTNDIKNGLSKYSLNTYTRRFGSWRNTLVTFVNWIKNDVDVQPSLQKEQLDHVPIKKASLAPVSSKGTHTTTRDIGLKLRFKVMQRDCFKCRFCGASPAKDPSIVLHIDHITPWSQGGETTLDNLQTLCAQCNLGKSDEL